LAPDKSHSTGTDPDDSLVARARAGDLDAFEALVTQHQAGLVRFLIHMVSNAEEAEDIAQDALLRAYRALKNFRGQSTFRTWLYQIAGNAARTHLERRRGRREDQADEHMLEQQVGHDRVEQQFVAHDQVRRALAALPDEWREAVVLRDIEGLDYREIAAALDIPMGTVESRIFRGRQRLREFLSGKETT
jgi:RNA polymerase sigma-70 factor, ECF subfamily